MSRKAATGSEQSRQKEGKQGRQGNVNAGKAQSRAGVSWYGQAIMKRKEKPIKAALLFFFFFFKDSRIFFLLFSFVKFYDCAASQT